MLRKISVAINVLRKNGFLGELQCLADNPPTLKMEDSANIKMALQGTFKKNVLDRWKHYVEFDPITDALQPVLTINGVKYELGIFLPTTVTPSYKDTAVEETIEIEAYDRSWLVATTTGIERVFFSRGTPYMEAIEQLLVASGITLINSTPCTEVLNEDREDWDLGTDYLTIINDLLKEINYRQLWFDNTGTAIIEPIDTPMVQNIKHTLDARNVTSLVHPGLSRKLDIYSTPNVFICTCNNPEKSAVLTAVARNENNHSPLSIQRRGREIVYYENVNNVASQDALQAYVDRLLFISLMSGESLSVTTSLLPDWGIGDIVSLHYLDVHALCVSHSWNMTLAAGGTMTHDLEKIVYNLDPEIYGDDVSDESDDEHLVPYTPWDEEDDNDNDDEDDKEEDTNLPDEIRIITLPSKLSYTPNEQIDLTGIVVKAYWSSALWISSDYPEGSIPFEELVFSPTSVPDNYSSNEISVVVSWNRPVDGQKLSTTFLMSVNNIVKYLPTSLEISWLNEPEDYYLADEDIDFVDDSRPTIIVYAVDNDGRQSLVSNDEIIIERTGRTLVETVVPAEVPELNIAHEIHGTYKARSKDGNTTWTNEIDIVPDDPNAICFTYIKLYDRVNDTLTAFDHVIYHMVLSANEGSIMDGMSAYSLQPLLNEYSLRIFGGKQVYYDGGGGSFEEGYAQLNINPIPSENASDVVIGGQWSAILWTLVHGSYNIYTDTYTVSWPREEDGQIITGTFEITTRG